MRERERKKDSELLKARTATVVFIKTYYCSHDRSQSQYPFHCKDIVPFPARSTHASRELNCYKLPHWFAK